MRHKVTTNRRLDLGLPARAAALATMMALLITPLAWSQSIENGAIIGSVADAQGEPLPGVTVTLTAEGLGTLSTTQTNDNGQFRFMAIPASTYSVEASLEGFSTVRQEEIVLFVTRTLTINLTMELGSFEDVIVVESAALIDVQDSQLQTMELPNAVLMEVPTQRDIRDIVKLSPGVHSPDPDGGSFSAYGSSDQGIQYSVDGVIINSPEAGETEVDMAFLGLEEVSILGLGAPAEYDGFSGVIVNVTTKKGENQIHGLADLYFLNSDWQSDNTSNPELERGGSNQTAYEAFFNVGGPITQDSLWYFTSIRYLSEEGTADPGFPNDPTFTAPRLMGKLTWAPSQDTFLSAMVEYSTHDAKHQGADEGGFVSPEATFDNEQTQWTWNFNYTNMLSSNTILEAKFGGYYQRQDEIPNNGDTPAHFDGFEDLLTENWPGPFEANRERYMVGASLSYFTDNFITGSHDFKFGADYELTKVNTLYAYAGGRFYYDFAGEPYLRYDWNGYDTFADTTRVSVYAQDSWAVSDDVRINYGLRLNDWVGDLSSNVDGQRVNVGKVFEPDVGIAPRLGITVGLDDDNTAVFKAHYGRYYHQVIALFYSRLAPESDLSGYFWDPDEEEWILDFTEIRDQSQFSVGDLSVPFMDAWVAGFEKVLSRDLSIDITGTYRTNHDFLDKVNLTGEFEPLLYTDPFTGKTFDVLNQTNEGENQFLFTNVTKCRDYGQAYRPLTCFDKKREYWGITASFNKRWRNNWQLQGSYTYGESTGNDDNVLLEFGEGRGSSLGGSAFFTDPNIQINATGNLTIDPTHLVKLVGSANVGWDVLVGGYFRFFTGNTYNQLINVEDVDQRSTIYGAKAGSFREEDGVSLDLRVEKLIDVGADKSIGIGIELFNIFNAGTVVESEQSVDSERPFGSPNLLVQPRRWRLGLRFRF